jgi:hypothetical protein
VAVVIDDGAGVPVCEQVLVDVEREGTLGRNLEYVSSRSS